MGASKQSASLPVSIKYSMVLINYFSHVHIFSSYAGGHTWEHEPNIHTEPYGYELGDDPFETQGQLDYPYMILFFAIISFTFFCQANLRYDRRKLGEVFYHQRLTANQLEDEIRELRKLKK